MASEDDSVNQYGNLRFFRTYTYNSPDGQDCLKKTAHTAKLTAFIGAYFATYDVVTITRPKGVQMIAGRLLSLTGPFALAGGLFASTSCLMGEFRGKDDFLNHACGGFLGGVVVAGRMGPLVSITVGMISAATLAIVKQAKLAGIRVWLKEPPPKEQFLPGFFGPKNRLSPPKDY